MASGDDRAATESILREVEASGRRDAAAQLVRRSRAALDRAGRFRSSGDEPHARLADRVAWKWAEAARDVARAATIEESAAMARRSAVDAGIVADRERALLEEAIAQSGRLRAQLDAVERDTREQPARTSSAASSGDAGAHAPVRTPPNVSDGGAAPPVRKPQGGSR